MLLPPLAMKLDPVRRETSVRESQQRPGTMRQELNLDRRRAGRDSALGHLPSPGELQAPVGHDLQEPAHGKADDTGVIWQTQSFPPHWVGTEIRIELSDNPDAPGTRVLFTHAGFKEADAGMAPAAYTWGQTLARLKGYTETGESQPYFVR